MARDPLKIEVAPGIVEHLGLNLYTSLPRVLVEFVANAYDADATYVNIEIDKEGIKSQRAELKDKHGASPLSGLAEQVLDDDLKITIVDDGHGMSRDELQKKFLRIGRKRRHEADCVRSPKGRIVMGRKGIGKLAAFGVAHRMKVVSKASIKGDAIGITLYYPDLVGKETTTDVSVPETVETRPNLGRHGTKVILSSLVYEPAGARVATIEKRIAEHFAFVKSEEFKIKVNGEEIRRASPKYRFVYPDPESPVGKLVKATVKADDQDVPIAYRIRFTEKSLPAVERGVCVYARQRLAGAPDLLGLPTGMHGFHNSDYLTGEVHADFIEDREADYISSNRQSLRWETPFLDGLRSFLTSEMQDAIKACQNQRDVKLPNEVKEDSFTIGTIEGANLPKHRKATAFKIAVKLAGACKDSITDDYYKSTLPIIVKGLGYGELMTAIAQLAKDEHPSFPEVVGALTSLTSAEWDEFSRVVSGRLEGIGTLRRIYQGIDFNESKNEGELHKLLKTNPWLIDPTFWQFLTSDDNEQRVVERLAKELEIGEHVADGYDKTEMSEIKPYAKNPRPDLVFLLNNSSLNKKVVVELKAPNTPLLNEHLSQLEDYMRDIEEWLIAKDKGRSSQLRVEGLLIGERDKAASRKLEVRRLRDREKRWSPADNWRVLGINQLLERAEDAHKELLLVQQRAESRLENASD